MAESRSLRVAEAPCMDVPPDKAIFALGVGEEVREVCRTLGRSEIRGPMADGGCLGKAVREVGVEEDVGRGS